MMVNPAEQRILDDVEQFGWHIICVGPAADSDDPEEWFAYTIGLSKTFGWSELICFGLDLQVMGNLLNDAVEECRTTKVEPSHGLTLRNVIQGFPAKLVHNDTLADEYVNSALWFARHEGVSRPTVLQLLWPDRDGYFPDESGCSNEVRQLQTPLEHR